MADEPMPASQANTIEVIGPVCEPEPASVEEATDFLPFMLSMPAVAAPRSPSLRSSLSRKPAIRKETAAEAITDRVTPTISPGGDAAQTAMIEPGAAGDRRPASKATFTPTPVMPPPMTAETRIGFIST